MEAVLESLVARGPIHTALLLGLLTAGCSSAPSLGPPIDLAGEIDSRALDGGVDGPRDAAPAAAADAAHDAGGDAAHRTGDAAGLDAATDGGDDGAADGSDDGAVDDGGDGWTDSGAEAGPCAPDCTLKVCGDDGCGGTCGGCPPSQLCGGAGTCVASGSLTDIVIDADSQRTTIPAGIYGLAFSSDDSLKVATLNRLGGDATSSYNWQTDAFNSGGDWYCANYVGLFTSPAPDPRLKSSVDQFVHYNVSKGVDTLLTIPITGWVAKDADPWNELIKLPDCSGAFLGVWDPTASGKCCQELGTSHAQKVDPTFMGDWVRHLVATFGTAAKGGVKYYQLDNEPDNWQALRTDIYPTLYPPGGWCEPFYVNNVAIGKSLDQDFADRTIDYAKTVKTADPTASVLFMSTENASDLVALPNVECGSPPGPYTLNHSLTRVLLKRAADDDALTGVRSLDCVDMHYPFVGNGLGDTQVLWDQTFRVWGGLVVPPRIQGWINAAYPGTGICVSEYNVPNDGGDGNAADPSTAAQLADIVGMFGRLGYRLASYWGSFVHKGTPLPIYNAVAMYRSYDGKGGHFGGYSIGAASPNAGVNVYAAADSPTMPTKVWIMLVNVSGVDQKNLTIDVRNFAPRGLAELYRSDGTKAPAADAPVAVVRGSITGLSLPANAIALLVLSSRGAPGGSRGAGLRPGQGGDRSLLSITEAIRNRR